MTSEMGSCRPSSSNAGYAVDAAWLANSCSGSSAAHHHPTSAIEERDGPANLLFILDTWL
jgi:hypothetical protein